MFSKFLIAFCVVHLVRSTLIRQIAEYDYCKNKCKGNVDNTPCARHLHCQPVSGCFEIEMDKDKREEILNIHNHLRDMLAGGKDDKWKDIKASNMIALSYDLQLEYLARCWVNTCQGGHDPCRITQNHPSIGQNSHWTSANEINITRAVEGFYNEKENMNDAQFDHFSGKGENDGVIGHFTQVVWAKTVLVGCAAAKGKKGSYLICNYAPAGNWKDEPLFTRGDPCSACPDGKSCNDKYESLCGPIMAVPYEKWSDISSARRLFKMSNYLAVWFVYFICLYVFQ